MSNVKTFRVVTAVLMLGYTRLQGFVIYDSETKAFEETTPAEVRRLIKAGANLHGVKIDADDKNKFDIDTDFYQNELPIKTACGKFRLLVNDDGKSNFNDVCYSVVKKIIGVDGETSFEVVTNHCARLEMDEEQLKQRIALAYVAGAYIDESGELVIHDSIPVEDNHVVFDNTDAILNEPEESVEPEVTERIQDLFDGYSDGINTSSESSKDSAKTKSKKK